MRAGLIAAILLALMIGPLAAQPLDLSQGGPITVTALGGIEWRQNQQEVIAHGDARAVRGNVTVTADDLIAHYRHKAGTTADAAPEPVQQASTSAPTATDTGGQEIYRLEAIGHVHIFTATDQGFGDHAIYDLDTAVLVLTGQHLKLTNPQDVLTARDDIEYWPDRHMAVARGDAVVISNDGRRLSADTLVAYFKPSNTPAGAPQAADAKPAPATTAAATQTDPLAASSKVERVEAFGHVVVRTATDTVTGDRGVYIPETKIALILDNVRITRGQNQLNGARGVVDMNTGVADLLSAPGARVQGLVVPNSVNNADTNAQPAGPTAPEKKP